MTKLLSTIHRRTKTIFLYVDFFTVEVFFCYYHSVLTLEEISEIVTPQVKYLWLCIDLRDLRYRVIK